MSGTPNLEGLNKLLEKNRESGVITDHDVAALVDDGTVTFYARLQAARYCFADGGEAKFVNGVYLFNPKIVPDWYTPKEGKTPEEGWALRFKELKYVCNIPNPVFSATPVEVQQSDAKVLREVGFSGGGVGMATSISNSALLQRSNAQ